MGTDYVNRQAAKKNRKRVASMNAELGVGQKTRRERKKKNQSRRLCKGMCYKLPTEALTADDKKWEEGTAPKVCVCGCVWCGGVPAWLCVCPNVGVWWGGACA